MKRHPKHKVFAYLLIVMGVVITHNGSLKFEITAKRLYAASQRVL